MYDKSRLSLMTHPVLQDIFGKSMSVKDSLELAKANGIPYIDIMLVRTEKDVKKYQAAMAETGVKVYTYIANISFISGLRARRKKIIKNLDIAKALGAKYLMIVPYSGISYRRAMRLGREKVKQMMIDGFTEAVELGKEYGIGVCVETTPHDVSCICGTQDCLDVLNAVPELDFVFDTGNMLPHGDDPLEAYEALKGRISHVHLKDVVLIEKKKTSSFDERTPDGKVMKCVIWGQGIIPVQKIYDRMIADGYKGCFAIEYARPEGKASCKLEDHIPQLGKFFEG